MIDTSTWKEFKISDLFDVKNSKSISDKRGLDFDGNNPYDFIGRTLINNGIQGKIVQRDFEPNDENTFSVTQIGEKLCLFRDNKWYACQNIFLLTPLYSELITAKFFICCIVTKTLKAVFGEDAYSSYPTKDTLSDMMIKLPATLDGQPDWDYMESYMKAVMEESEKSLENLKKADDTKHLIDVRGWGEFDVIKFFTVLSGRAKLSNADIDDGDTPVYSSNSTNGGIFGYTTKSPDYEVNDENPFYITFGDHTKAVNIADKSFCVMDNVKVLTSNISNYNVLHFIITSWLRNVPDLGYARHWSKAEKAKIWLPITSTGKPDWQYMEDYMRNIMDKSEQIISNLQIGA